MRTKREATAAGKELLARMKGRGWKLRVWENMGWHYAVINGPLSIHRCIGGGGYFALLSDNLDNSTCFGGTGANFWTTAGKTFTDPNDAVENQMQVAHEFVAACALILSTLDETLAPTDTCPDCGADLDCDGDCTGQGCNHTKDHKANTGTDYED